jgi:hypothetical protein
MRFVAFGIDLTSGDQFQRIPLSKGRMVIEARLVAPLLRASKTGQRCLEDVFGLTPGSWDFVGGRRSAVGAPYGR